MKSTGKPWGRKPVTVTYDDEISRLSWQQFEHVVADWYIAQGYTVDHRGTGARGAIDGGVDLVVWRDGKRLLVQCKHEKVYQVPYNPVMQLAALIKGYSDEPADGAIFVTSGEFTREAITRASRFPELTLIDGAAFRDMLVTVPAASVPASLPGEFASHAPADVAVLVPHAPMISPVVPSATAKRSTRLPVATRKTSPGLPRAAAIGCLLAGIAALGFLGVRLRNPGTDATAAAGASPTALAAVTSAVPDASGRAAQEGSATRGHEAAERSRAHGAVAARHRPTVQNSAQSSSGHRAAPGGISTKAGPAVASVASTDAVTETSAIYRSGAMSAAEFAAWKQRRATRNATEEQAPATQERPADVVDNTGTQVSPEAMKVILRTNRP